VRLTPRALSPQDGRCSLTRTETERCIRLGSTVTIQVTKIPKSGISSRESSGGSAARATQESRKLRILTGTSPKEVLERIGIGGFYPESGPRVKRSHSDVPTSPIVARWIREQVPSGGLQSTAVPLVHAALRGRIGPETELADASLKSSGAWNSP